MNPPPRRVLVIITRRIGDVLLATPVLRSLKRAWPQTTIDALVFTSSSGVLAANPDIDVIHVIPERPGLLQHIDFIRKIFRHYDLAVSLLPGDRPTLYAFFAGRKRLGSLLAARKDDWKKKLLHQWVAYQPENQHTVLTHLAVLTPLGVTPTTEVVVSWHATDQRIADDALAPLKQAPYVVLHTYPKFNYKMWHDAGWTALAHWIVQRGLGVVLTGSHDAAERDYIARLTNSIPSALNLAGRLSLNQSACVIAHAKAYVGPDTALTHTAAALGVPTIALFGPTDPVRWGPWPKGHDTLTNPWRRVGDQAYRCVRLIQGASACVPCGHEGCERHIGSYSDCLLDLPATHVIQALSEVANIP